MRKIEAQRSFAYAALNTRQRERESMRAIPLGFGIRVIMYETPLNLEKTTYSVLSVMLFIYDWTNQTSVNSIYRVQTTF